MTDMFWLNNIPSLDRRLVSADGNETIALLENIIQEMANIQ